MVTIRRKDLYKFEGQYKGYTGWFDLDHDIFKIKISTLEQDLYKKHFIERKLKVYTLFCRLIIRS